MEQRRERERGNGKEYLGRKGDEEEAQRNLALENFRSASRAGEFARPK